MADRSNDRDLPISWDEAREVVIVVLLVAASLYIISPIVGWLDPRVRNAAFADDLAFMARNVSPSSGLMLLGAGVLLATTPRSDVVPALRRAVVLIAGTAVLVGVVAMIVELTRVSGSGMSARLQTIFGRSGPGVLLAATTRWLALRVESFDDRSDG